MREVQFRSVENRKLIGKIWEEKGMLLSEGVGDDFLNEARELGWPEFQMERRGWCNGYVYAQLRKRK